jgi:hypothetical protein
VLGCVFIGTPGGGLPLPGMEWDENKFPIYCVNKCVVVICLACHAGSPGGGIIR